MQAGFIPLFANMFQPGEDLARRRSPEGASPEPPPNPGLLQTILRGGWLPSTPPPPSSAPAAPPPSTRTLYPRLPDPRLPSGYGMTEESGFETGFGDPSRLPRETMTRAQVPGAYGEDLSRLAQEILAGRGGVGKPLTRLRAADVPPLAGADIPTLKRYFEMGAKNPSNVNWYTESQKAGEQLVGEDEPLFRLFGSIFSQRKGPVPETNLAMKAYRAWKEGGVDALRTMRGPSAHQRGELIRGALQWENNPATVESLAERALTPGSMKRRDYFGARGLQDVSVIDTHAGAAATGGRFEATDPRQYYGVQHVYHTLADEAGVPRKGYQAAVWVPWRAEMAAQRGVPAGDPDPAARILMKAAETNPDYQALVRQGLVQAPPKDWRTALKWGLLGTVGAGAAGARDREPSMAERVFP
jgi:hypothetical protein